MKDLFRKLAKHVADWTGSPGAFAIAVMSVVIWALLGPMFHYSENWQLVINTSTTIITFLMVFLIQNLQNRDSQILHLKVDELIRANKRARNDLINLEGHSDEYLNKLHQEFCSLKADADSKIEKIENLRTRRKQTKDRQ